MPLHEQTVVRGKALYILHLANLAGSDSSKRHGCQIFQPRQRPYCVESTGSRPTLQSAPCRDYPSESSKMDEKVMVFKMSMTCEGCGNAARKILKKLGDGVTKVDFDYEEQTVTVTTTLTVDRILLELKKTGKDVEFVKTTGSDRN